MVTCNLCGENKSLEDLHRGFRYVCKKCWNELIIGFNTASGFRRVDKNMIY